MAFDFGRIGDIISKYVDSDFIDIKRDISGKLQEVYSNIPCHVAYASTDNPDPTTVDIKPVIQSITVHCPLYVDIRNNDFIVAKKIGSDGSLIATYSGRCGNPVVSQGRKKVLMQMNGTEPEEPTPLPQKEGAAISVSCVSDGKEILQSAEQAEVGKPFVLEPPAIDGYTASECYIDGILQESTSAYIADVQEGGHEVRFVYSVSGNPGYFRFLANGLYTKDDGSLASGLHLYKKVPVTSIIQDNGTFSMTCQDVRLVHEDGGNVLSVEPGAKIVLVPGDIYAEVSEIKSRWGGMVTFKADSFVPTDAERNAYRCNWYD